MSVTADEIVTAAIQLSESDRLAIVSRLLETMGEEDILQSVDDADFIDWPCTSIGQPVTGIGSETHRWQPDFAMPWIPP